MATEKQTIANRWNAQKSTGPRSAEGKARSRQNALTHGLSARQVLLPGEDPAEFEAFCQAMVADLAPEGTLEHHLVGRATSLAWRLRRVPAVEGAVYEWVKEGQAREYDYDGSSRRQALEPERGEFMGPACGASREILQVGRAFQELFDTNLTSKLSRHEISLQRQLFAVLKELREVQRARREPTKHVEVPAQTLACERRGVADRESLDVVIQDLQGTLEGPGDFDNPNDSTETALPGAFARPHRSVASRDR